MRRKRALTSLVYLAQGLGQRHPAGTSIGGGSVDATSTTRRRRVGKHETGYARVERAPADRERPR